jgi:hypothetical protein
MVEFYLKFLVKKHKNLSTEVSLDEFVTTIAPFIKPDSAEGKALAQIMAEEDANKKAQVQAHDLWEEDVRQGVREKHRITRLQWVMAVVGTSLIFTTY